MTVPFSVAAVEASRVTGASPTGSPAAGVLAVGPVAPGVAVVGVLVAGVVGPGGALVRVVTATVVAVGPFPASATRETASTASDASATSPTTMTGAFQFEVVARRVRAAAPQ